MRSKHLPEEALSLPPLLWTPAIRARRKGFVIEHTELLLCGIVIARGVSAVSNTQIQRSSMIVLKRILTIVLTGMLLTMAVGLRQVNAQSGSDRIRAPRKCAWTY